MSVRIVPSYPAPSFTELARLLDELRGTSSEFQIDIVDGKFAPFTSWPFVPGAKVESLLNLRSYTDDYRLELDCMVERPEQYLDVIIRAGFKRVIIHYGTTDTLREITARLQRVGIEVGVAGTYDSLDIKTVTADLQEVDFVQVMGIANVGQQGQPFDERILTTITKLRGAFPEREIAVDGAVNEDTIEQLVRAGATRLAPGSAISKASDAAESYKHLVTLANR